jgi:CheY-like chemotaxis protein
VLPQPGGSGPGSSSSAARLIEGLARATGTLLIVEDEPTVRLLMKRILEGRGYFVIAAKSGEEAMELARTFGGVIDGLVADVILSGMTGTELAHRLRDRHSDLRVLLVSGYSAEALRDYRVLDETMSFLPKPFTPDTLLERVAEVLAAGRG